MSRRLCILLAGAALLAGCGDAPTAPEALLLAADVEAALQVPGVLPELPALVARAHEPERAAALPPAARALLVRADSLWRAAGSAEAGEGVFELRAGAGALAAPVLAGVLDSAEVAAERRAVEVWLAVAERVRGLELVPEIGAELARARAAVRAGARAEARGDLARALAAYLSASERLRLLAPQAVARRLLREGTAALAAVGVVEEGTDAALARRRADRLLKGARQALERGDYELSIRRAYYARELMRATANPAAR